MEPVDILKHTANFKKARSNFVLAVAFTLANLILIYLDASFYFPFSIYTPLSFLMNGKFEALYNGDNLYLIVSVIIALVILALFFLCWLISGKKRVFILIALILFGIDSVIMLIDAISVLDTLDASFLIDIAFHAWVLYFLVMGTMAWAKLRGVSPEAVAAAQACGVNPAPIPEQTTTGDSIQESTPLRPDDKNGRILIKADYEDLHISMKRTRGLTELIINGNVYDEIAGMVEKEYALHARVYNTYIRGECKSSRSHMYLYANNQLIAKKLRIF